ncbi:hypothetical protein FKP32DRAFT_1670651 [Trametes sanguinea]|nr:hypothetical protein FKP32DRAFT_1670651 [Trametes sanguinea]
MNGLIGLAGYSQTNDSSIYTLLKNTSYAENGVPIIYNIFEHGPQLPNYMTFLTERGSQGFTDGGVLTICRPPMVAIPLPVTYTLQSRSGGLDEHDGHP